MWTTSTAARVEVEDDSPHFPERRQYADTAGTGRGLHLIDEVTDQWGTRRRPTGKTVWFELGDLTAEDAQRPTDDQPAAPGSDVVSVTLRHAPILMHWAWQEHAAALLREYLLHILDQDPSALDKHAGASEAMSLLHHQMPAPTLPDDPEGLMSDALEPRVTADEVVLHLPPSSVPHFATLNDLLTRAGQEAQVGRFLGPPVQPEIAELREWICTEVARQAQGVTTATPWLARTDIRATLADQTELLATYAEIGNIAEPLLATDEASIIVAASQSALELLGYDRAEDLVGRRVLVVVPNRYHQAHIAGTTLNATNGRATLLGVPIVVPMIRADGTEITVSIQVRPERLDEDHRVFIARFHPA